MQEWVREKKFNHSYYLHKIISKNIPTTLHNEEGVPNWDHLQTILKELVLQHDLQHAPIALHIPANLARMQYLQLPLGLSDTEISQEISTQMHRDFPTLTKQLWIDFVITKNLNPLMEIFFVAVKTEYIKQYLDCVNATGLKVSIVDIDALALKRVIDFYLLPEKIDSPMVIYLTDEVLTLIIFNRLAVVSRQQWLIEQENNFLVQLKLRITNAAKNPFHSIKQIIICCNDKDRWLQESLVCLPDVNIILLSLSRIFKVASINDKSYAQYLVSYGLAMRELPSWC